MTHTTNYQLPKWEKTDRVQMKDFNDMTATLAAALKANADAIAAETTARVAGDTALQTAIAARGNCEIICGTYTGDGAGSKTLTFNGKPVFVLVQPSGGSYEKRALTMIRGMSYINSEYQNSNTSTSISWTNTSVTFNTKVSYGLNVADTAYSYLALLEK